MSANENINNTVLILVDSTFKKLGTEHKELLKKYLYDLCILLGKYLPFENYFLQLKQNNNRDIYSLMVLLLPYYDINKSEYIVDLGELFYNKDNKSINLSSTFYYDHNIDEYNNSDAIIRYLNTSIALIQRTFATVCNKLTPNWLNIFPHTMSDYKKSDVYKEFELYYKTKKFPEYKYFEYYNFKLGYHTLYGTIRSFLYDDIKDIKWMIYDINDNNKVYPSILSIVNLLGIPNIINEPWDKLTDERKNNIKDTWYRLTNSEFFIRFSSFIMFYLRWERDNEKLADLKLPKTCIKILDTHLNEVGEFNELEHENLVYTRYGQREKFKIYTCLKLISGKIKIEDLYNYAYNCCQKFRYTWYGYCCLNENKQFLDVVTYYSKYLNSSNRLGSLNDETKYYITPKMTYNFFKSILHEQIAGGRYTPYSNTNSWDNLLDPHKQKFTSKLNANVDNMKTWFNIANNISNLYMFDKSAAEINKIQTNIINNIVNTNWISQVIFECLVYNGILTYFKYNPQVTDNTILPDKNKFKARWESELLSKVSLEPYKNSYHFLDNKQLELHKGLLDMVKKSKWYTNFGADWIAQIQVFHHFINQRIMFVTGATGAGKSTVYPFMMLYATKIINYNNNGKVFCTQPRIQPTVGNATWMAQELGIPIQKAESDGKINNMCSSEAATWLKSDIDYIQYIYSDGNIADDIYHPTLRLLTDGYLYSVMKNDYVLKKRIIENTNKKDEGVRENFTAGNLFDVLLIDESHEHNPYMDMILTLCKFALYINNEVTMGIVSATMDDDESTYRKYFESIDDNWKAPLKLDNYIYSLNKDIIQYNRGRLDRRIHLSVPFGGMNFNVEVTDNIKMNEVEIVKKILSTSTKGDILIFKPGTAEIISLVTEMNANVPSDVLAIPFIGTITPAILDIIKQIDKPNIRKSIRYPKNYTIDQMCDVPESELLPIDTYKRFIIIATNIAEASITIDTLEYVIDDGNQKIMYYDVDTNQSKLLVKRIALPNQKQRKGRIGRTQPGKAYFTYPISELETKVIYKLCSDNINDKILDLLSLTNTHFFSSENNPYLISIYGINSEQALLHIPIFLKNQYCFINASFNEDLFYNKKAINIDFSKIIYPYSDGRYDMNTLMDKQGIFYIIHPNETELKRNEDLTIKTDVGEYKNKVESMVKYYKLLRIINNDSKITSYGQLLVSCVQLFELQIEPILTLIDMLSFKYNVNDKKTDVFRNIIWFCVFSSSSIMLNLPRDKKVNSDFLAKADIIPIRLLYIIDLLSIVDKLDSELTNLSLIIELEVNNIIEMIPNHTSNIKLLKTMLIGYYKIKLKIELLEELANPQSTIIWDPINKTKINQGQIKKNSQLIKNINMTYLPKIFDSDINIIKSLNYYEQSCFFICKNMRVNLLLKITNTPYYINYFERSYNNIFQISYGVSPYNKQKRFVYTNVNNEYRNNIIFYLASDESNKISNIMWIPSKIIYLLQQITPLPIRNNIIDRVKINQIHGTEEENNILQKIDIINDYIINR
jgi:hypothetical protein